MTAVKCLLFGMAFALLTTSQLVGDTFVPTTIATTTWTKEGNRYIITASTTVPVGQTLTIEPGVDVILGAGVQINVLGRIYALGTISEPIAFRSPISTAPWGGISVPDSGSSANSIFHSCVFSNATTGLWLFSRTSDAIETQEVSNCIFEDCGNGIYGLASNSSLLNPLIQNCQFINCSINGMMFDLATAGEVNATIRCNSFRSIGDAAISFHETNVEQVCQPQIINNSIFNAMVGIRTSEPYDVIVKNNIFASCSVAMQRLSTDILNLAVNHNDFHNNGTNFSNYPPQYGSIIWNNANGDPADISFNIFEDPLFVDTNTLALASNSQCIDAGDPEGTYMDGCFPPSHSTTINDIGAYGGPFACGWLEAPLTSFTLGVRKFIGVTISPNTSGRYRLEYTPTLENMTSWTQITNVNLLSTPWTYIDFDSPGLEQRNYRAVLLP